MTALTKHPRSVKLMKVFSGRKQFLYFRYVASPYICLYEQHHFQREPLFRDRFNPLQFYDGVEFWNLFRFTKNHVLDLTNLVAPLVEHGTGRNYALSPLHRVCIRLQFFATGCFQMSVGSWINVNQSTVSRTVWRVTRAIIDSHPNAFVLNMQSTKGFFEKFNMPNIIGALDCTRIRIRAPAGHHYPEEYLNRKNFHSLNI